MFPTSIGEGVIDLSRGVVLYGSSYWYPHFQGKLFKTKIAVSGLPGWSWVTSPEGKISESLYLFGGPFYVYKKIEDKITYQVLLKKSDSALASKFLVVMPSRIKHYEKEIGPYPYEEFSVVENIFEETGYGMPAFTLLGSQVIRLPFIFVSSLPHEILHNWWGNGVFVDDQFGNWSEGLSTFQSDYAHSIGQGRESLYRLNELFRYRHNDASQALGYGKILMVFHMLKNRIGESNFAKAIQNFYRLYQFQKAHFFQLQEEFSQVSGDFKLKDWFLDWVTRVGQVKLEIRNVFQEELRDGTFLVQFDLDQHPSYLIKSFELPIEFLLKSQSKKVKCVRIEKKPRQTINFIFPTQVLSFQVDPKFDVFRKVGDQESPAQLLNLFVSEKFFLYSDLESQFESQLTQILSNRFANIKKWDKVYSLSGQSLLPETLVVLGWNDSIRNFVSPFLQNLSKHIVLNSDRLQYRDEKGLWQDLQTHYSSSSILILNGREVLKDDTVLLPLRGELFYEFQ
jgi:hypothetical protein